MIKEIRKKLGSQSGASMMFALLLFLVCAAIGGIVLNAGTLSTSKLVDRAKMDKRYYEVTSAVEFLKERFNGDENIVITRTKTTTSAGTTYSFTCNDTDLATLSSLSSMNDLSSMFAVALLGNIYSIGNDSYVPTSWSSDFYNSVNLNLLAINFKHDETTSRSVIIGPKVVNGVVELDIKSSDEKYVLKMIMVPEIKEVTSKNGDTEKKVATINFTVSDIKKVF